MVAFGQATRRPHAIMGNDFNLALVALLFATVLTLVGNLLADIAYAWLDPRISYR